MPNSGPFFPDVAGVVVIALLALVFMRSRPATQAATYYEVKRGDFLHLHRRRRHLGSGQRSEHSQRGRGRRAASFTSLPEGTYVKQGDLLVELDSSATQDAVSQQQINVGKSGSSA